MREWLSPGLIVAALVLGLTGLPDRIGLIGASQGLLIGAAICAPLWLFKFWRESRGRRED
ncbi:MAG: hypothetical protein DI565_07405 [Ancylobacter novellus]|uniref:Uncharacterized protein n=1 Tax=Ancylobacter novellus TaxID=921 RepID=A0A2W5KME8_ANCNO|nr:MAG: hypothetical protein DI565_07405 [Ancylobacter novellus]